MASGDVAGALPGNHDAWVSERDEGQTAAINAGLRRATGDVLGYINSDDLYFPGAFQRVADAFARDPAADFVHGDGDVIDGTAPSSGNGCRARTTTPS